MASVLLVDNDERIVELMAFFLGQAGHAVETTTSYAAARERLGEGFPDLMLADLELGVERGEEELPALEREGLLPPTLIVSGFLERDSEARLMALGPVLGTLAKPFGLDELSTALDEALERAATFRARSVSASGAAPVDEPAGPTDLLPPVGTGATDSPASPDPSGSPAVEPQRLEGPRDGGPGSGPGADFSKEGTGNA